MFSKSKTFIICELSQTHEGSISLAKMLIKAAVEAKADAVKAQVFTADELAVPSYKHYQLFKKLEWTEASWKELIDFSHEHGLKFFADVFGNESVAMLARNGIDGFKIHGTDMRNTRLLKCVSEIDVPILLSIGGGTVDETKEAVSILTKSRKSPLVLMHGFQSYPTLIEHTNLNKMCFFKDKFDLPVGFADHIDGDDRLNHALCAVAIGMGAVVIEKHITISRTLKMEDYESALSPENFVEFVSKTRELDKALGKYSEEMIPVEADYRKATRKHVVAALPIKAGQIINAESVTLRRAESEKVPSDIKDIIGIRSNKDYAINDVLYVDELG